MGTGKFNAGGNPAMDQHSIQGGVEILLVASCYRNRDKLWPDGPLGSNADFKQLGPVTQYFFTCLYSVWKFVFVNLFDMLKASLKLKSIRLFCYY